jgi:hypothetical protein
MELFQSLFHLNAGQSGLWMTVLIAFATIQWFLLTWLLITLWKRLRKKNAT